MIVAKQGEYGAALVTADGFFSLPAFPLESVVDPTGAGDTFAGGFVGYIAAHADEQITDELLRRAMAHGTALASFNVEEFGTERVERLTGEEIVARVRELRAITQFCGAPLRAAGLSRGAAPWPLRLRPTDALLCGGSGTLRHREHGPANCSAPHAMRSQALGSPLQFGDRRCRPVVRSVRAWMPGPSSG